jgi:signal transduction histidine kinase/ActR/RegA family two-component response regulator
MTVHRQAARLMFLRRFSTLPAMAGLALLYFSAAKLSLHLASVNASASPVWAPTGIALAGLLIFGYRTWPGIFLGAFLVNALTAGNIWTSLFIATGNTLEALCGAWLVNRFANGAGAFDRSQDVFKFTLAVVVGSLLAPTIGVTSLAISGFAAWANYSTIWLTWWLGDSTGALIVAPLLVVWSRGTWRFSAKRDLEAILLLLLLVIMGEVVFGGWFPISAKNYPISFLCGPVLIWAAFRLAQRETATGVLLLSAIAIWGTLHGFGPFVMESENQSLLIMNTSSAVLAVTALALSAAMSERKRAEAAIEQQKMAVEAANRTKDNFLAMLSHELRTPLTPVLATLDALETVSMHPDDSKAALSMIRRNVEIESQLIDDLLDLTRIAKDKLQLNFEQIDAHQAIQNVAEICQMEAQARRIRVHLNLGAGEHHITADTAKFQQIIWNLLKNAIKFTSENGEITIATANPSSQLLTIALRDTGIGMEAEIIERIFDPFEQGDQSMRRRFGGLGLGLAISKSLAQAHGGSLSASSEGRGYGSTFTFTLKTASPPTHQTIEPKAIPAAARSLRILLVDDHQDTCTALERLLVRRGHLVAATHNMRSAMEAAGRNQFDLLISDIALPDGTGMELMACLRAISGLRGIAISGFGMNGDIEKSLRAGFSEHLVKPVKLEKLEAAIDRVMGVEAASKS